MDPAASPRGRAGAPRWSVVRERRSWLRWTSADLLAVAIIEELCPTARPPVPAAGSRSALSTHQWSALTRLRAALERYGGALLADDVGMGKTFLGRWIAQSYVREGRRVLVVGPSALRPAWREVPADWLSYAGLSRNPRFALGREPYELVVFDEAHALRNPRTRRYRGAAALAMGAPCLLLSATPINNSVWDLYHLIRLFAGDGSFRTVGVSSLRSAFEDAAAAGSDGPVDPPAGLRPVLREIMVRRTRPFARRVQGERRDADGEPARGGSAGPWDERRGAEAEPRFPRRLPPVPIFYEPPPAAGGADVSEEVARLVCALRFPVHRLAGDGRAPPHALLRLTLLKRLESSLQAVQDSLVRYDADLARALDALDAGRMPSRVATARSADPLQLSLLEIVSEVAPASVELDVVARRVRSERARLAPLLVWLARAPDLKLAALRRLLAGPLRGRKCILFTSYRDTALHLAASLARFRTALITGSEARIGAAVAPRRRVIRSFAPRSNGAAGPAEGEAIDLLIATDVLSEGLDLQDASIVISYDLPWNPVRLLQRIGRVDRLGSPHDVVESYHFVPRGLERHLRLVARLRSKLDAAARTVGVADPVLHDRAARAVASADAEALSAIERAGSRWFEVPDELVLAARRWTKDHGAPELPRLGRGTVWCAVARRPEPSAVSDGRTDADAVPGRVATAVAASRPGTAVVLYRLGECTRWLVCPARQAPSEDDLRLCGLLSEALTGARHADSSAAGGVPAPGTAVMVVEEVLRNARRHIAGVAAARFDVSIAPQSRVARRVALRLLKSLSAHPGGATRETCERVDRALARLASGCSAGVEDRLRTVLRDADATPGPVTPYDLVGRVEECLPAGAATRVVNPFEEVEILAVLLAPDAVDDVRGFD